MNTYSTEAPTKVSFKKAMTECRPGAVPVKSETNNVLAAICFLLLRYSGKQEIQLPYFQDGKFIFRSWDINKTTTLKDLFSNFENLDPKSDVTGSPEQIAEWNPLFLFAESEDYAENVIVNAFSNSIPADLVFIILTGQQSGLSLYSSNKKHDTEFLHQILNHWKHSLSLLQNKPDSLALSSTILTDKEYQKIAIDWNDTDQPSEDGKFDFEEFDQRVKEAPDKIAISSVERSLTYFELQQQVNRMAHYLRGLGIGPEVIVGIYLKRSIEFVVALVGLIKSGGAFLPLDPDHPQDRKEFMIRDSQVPYIITSRSRENTLPQGKFQKIVIEDIWSELESFPTDTLDHGLESGSMSYLFYTSGSTGQPKGVIMTHSYQDKASDYTENFPIKSEKVLLKSSTGFTLILLETFSPLNAGGEIVVVPKNQQTDAAWMIKNIQEQQVETLNLVPSMLSVLLEKGLEKCTSIKKVFTVGEQLPVAVQKKFFNYFPDAKLYVFYGCTEAPTATFREILPDEDYGDRVVLGKPAINRKIYILDEFGVQVPVGVIGEIFIGGKISRGYIHNEALTKERFVVDPFCGQDGARMYQTGDLGRFLEDGSLEYLGRTDFQVQIRGIRIELGEIEFCAGLYPGVRECVTIAQEDSTGDNRLIAYIVPTDLNSYPDTTGLRQFLRERLPEYMIPAAFVVIDQVPLTTSGKIDRKSLPREKILGSGKSDDQNVPRTSLEQNLIKIWEDILDAKQVGKKDNFFALGGSSIKVMKLCHRVGQELGMAMSVATVFQYPTVELMAQSIGVDSKCENYALHFGGTSSRTPLFFLPGITRNALIFNELATNLSEDRPCYGIELPSSRDEIEPLTTIEELAAHCVDEIRKIQPVGPYILAGYSFGGLLAFEASRMLKITYEGASTVILFDSRIPSVNRYNIFDRFKWLYKLLIKEKSLYLTYVTKEIFYRSLTAIGMGRMVKNNQDAEFLLKNISPIQPESFHLSYDPQPHSPKVLVFTARDTEYSITTGNELMSWKDYCLGEIDFCRIDTDYHANVLNLEYLEIISNRMQEFMMEDNSS
jgi:amino acid adenylation domain-containing protein